MKKVCLALVFAACCGISNFAQTPTPTPSPMPKSGTGSGTGMGNAPDDDTGNKNYLPPPPPSKTSGGELTALHILSKPRPIYTLEARETVVTGVVRLRIVFSASGKIGSITSISGLPYGLTEQAIAAAKKIEFEPAKRDGVPYSVAKMIEYNFVDYDGYYNEDDKSLKKKVEIVQMPAPELSPEEIKKSGGKIKVVVLLDPQDGAGLIKPNPDWSTEFTQKIREAVVKIKFNPAINQSDVAVTQLKEIEYVFPE